MKKGISYPDKNSAFDVEENRSVCPVCFKTFQVTQIESHVNACLFLSSESKDKDSKYSERQKRQYNDDSSNISSRKKLKDENNIDCNNPSTSYTAIAKVSSYIFTGRPT